MIDISKVFKELFVFFEKKDIVVLKDGKLILNHNIERIYLTIPKGKVRVIGKLS